jgi:uncharacterized protein (DUF983 family)
MMSAGESQTPQFTTAEYPSGQSNLACAACRQPLNGSYFKIKGAPVCTACTEKIRAQTPRDSHGAFARALVFGIAGALIGSALYVVCALATGLVIGWVSLAVGFIVGKAMRLGSRGVGGRRYQIVALLLTYLAVSLSTVPIAIEQARHGPIGGKAVAELAMLGVASPILDLADPVHGLIGLVILFVGLRFAWRFTAAPTLIVSGPYTAATATAP